MAVGIFSYASDMSGGNYRFARTVSLFPRDRFFLMMPRDSLEAFRKSALRYSHDDGLLRLLDEAIVLPPISGRMQSPYGIVRYGSMVVRIAEEHGADLLYFPYGNQYFTLAFRLSGAKWTQLLQQSPFVGSLVYEDGHGFSLFRKNIKANYGYGELEVLKSYARLFILRLSSGNNQLLAVSRSIPYEMERLGARLNIRVVEPGNGVDGCRGGDDRDVDLVFCARAIPQKGVLDFVEVVRRLRPKRAVICGFMDDRMRMKLEAMKDGVNLEVMPNLPREEVMNVMGRAKLMVYPSRLDSFALVVLEALSCGTPVVAYGIPAIRFNYDTGAVVKVKPLDVDGLVRAAGEVLESGSWAELGKEGKAYSSRYTWQSVARAEWDALMEVHGSRA